MPESTRQAIGYRQWSGQSLDHGSLRHPSEQMVATRALRWFCRLLVGELAGVIVGILRHLRILSRPWEASDRA